MKIIATACALLVTALAMPASATSLIVNAHEVRSGGPSFWTTTTGFVLPSGFTNAVLHITDFGIDDRGTVALNGTVVDSVGLFAPGLGNLVSTLGGANLPHVYPLADGARNVVVTSGFVSGLNTLLFTINDTSSGIFGDLIGGPMGTAQASAYAFNAELTYDAAAVPEPATWALLILGFGSVGARARRRRHLMRPVAA